MNLIKKIKLLPNAIKGYDRNDPFRNGEYKFLNSYIKSNMIVFDIGANVGDYTKYILKINPNVKVFCFEPVLKTYNTLIKNLSSEIKDSKVVCNNLALSNEIGEAEMYIYDDFDGRNSLHFNPVHSYDPKILHKEKANLTTLDDYVIKNGIDRIDLLKIDVEGHETRVIEGAANLIKKKMIKCIQFEYNNNWASAEFTLQNIYNLLSEFGYKFYRLAIWGKIPIKTYNKKLDNYRHSNYISMLND